MKQLVSDLVQQVKNESGKRISAESIIKEEKGKVDEKIICPKCKKGTMLKGKTAFGCSDFKNGCDFKIPFELMDKKLSDNQIFSLIEKEKQPL